MPQRSLLTSGRVLRWLVTAALVAAALLLFVAAVVVMSAGCLATPGCGVGG